MMKALTLESVMEKADFEKRPYIANRVTLQDWKFKPFFFTRDELKNIKDYEGQYWSVLSGLDDLDDSEWRVVVPTTKEDFEAREKQLQERMKTYKQRLEATEKAIRKMKETIAQSA